MNLSKTWDHITSWSDKWFIPYWYFYLIALALIIITLLLVIVLRPKKSSSGRPTYEQHMRNIRREYKKEHGHYPEQKPKVKVLPKTERKELEIYAIKSHYDNYEVRIRDERGQGIKKWDDVFDTKEQAIEFRDETAKKLSSVGHKVKNDKEIYW